jgi:alanine dehydrogenase
MGINAAMEHDPGLAKGLNVIGGRVVHPAVAETFNLPVAVV